MFKRTQLLSSILLAFGGTVGPFAGVALAQESAQRVEITGSAIRRVQAEGALPVQVIRKEEIDRTGATSTVDLLQKLPSIQGAVTETAGVGGNSYGFAGVSIHNLTENRTLVLLNGRRLAQFGGQTLTGFAAAVDLNTIPIAAIERIEILSDGASALYGSDAIAGVVNFITKRDTQEGDITVGYSRPSDGATEKRVNFSKGFGNLESDGYNVLIAASADRRTKLNSTDRKFAKSGIVNFNANGKTYQFFNGSPRGIPANTTDDDGDLVSPYLLANGSCPDVHVSLETAPGKRACYYDFVTQLEIYPVRERESFMTSFTKKLGTDHTFGADLLLARTKSISRIAPVPGEVLVEAGSALHNQYLLPVGITEDSVASYRAADLGKRTSDDKADFRNLSLSLKGTVAGWDYDTAYTHSESIVKGSISGYPGAIAFNRLLTSGLLNPFVGPGQQSAEALQAINGASYKGYWDGGESKLDGVELRASRAFGQLAGGPMQFGTGINFFKERFESKPSLFAQGVLTNPVTGELCDPDNDALPCDQRFGDASAKPPYKSDRHAWGLFGEMLFPIARNFELTTSVRYDKYSDSGNSTTGKAAFRWNPTPQLLVRGSVGTGFRAPTVPQLNGALQSYGVTSGNYDCTPELAAIAAAQGATCRPSGTQYDVYAGGNKELKPEKSKQATLGIRFEPSSAISAGADLWMVALRDTFGQITEQEAFANPNAYAGAWTSAVDVGTGTNYLAYNQSNLNLGKTYMSGIDFDVVGRVPTPLGTVTSQFVATYMLREKQQLVPGGEYYSAIGNNNESLGTVTFRWQGRLTTSLRAGAWNHTLGFNFKTGYKDVPAEVEVLDAAGVGTGEFEEVRLKVKRYYTFDWQSRVQLNKQFAITAGVLNIFDRAPPLSLVISGINKGQMVGYDDRYYDPRGRTFYINGNFAF